MIIDQVLNLPHVHEQALASLPCLLLVRALSVLSVTWLPSDVQLVVPPPPLTDAIRLAAALRVLITTLFLPSRLLFRT